MKIIGTDTFPTAYGFACGYIKRSGLNLTVTTWMEHGVYHVRAHDFNAGKRLGWETALTVGAAKKLHRAMCKRNRIQV